MGFADEEFWSSILKLAAIIIFMIIGIVLCCGGGPAGGKYDEYWGARTFYSTGAFANGFKGVCSVFVTAAFEFSGTELIGLAAAEAENPVKALPGAIKQVFFESFFFTSLLSCLLGFWLSIQMKGFLVPFSATVKLRHLSSQPKTPVWSGSTA